MSDVLDGKDFDFKAGYHAAMLEIAKLAIEVTKDAEGDHNRAKAGFFGGPTKDHHIALGRGRAAKFIGDHAFTRGQYAFLIRNKRVSP